MSPSRELSEKLNRVRAFLERERLEGVLLCTQRNFSWLSCGGLNHVGIATQDGVAWLLALKNGQVVVLAPNNEAARINEEETHDLGFAVTSIPWHELRSNPSRLRDAVSEFVDPKLTGADIATSAFQNVEPRFAALRYSLTVEEIHRYRLHAKAVAAAVETTARSVEPGMRERDIEAMLAGHILGTGARPTVLLIAADERFFRYRHPIPTDKELKRYIAISTCSRRWGLTAAVTRLVHFGDVPGELASRYAALLHVEHALVEATRPGTSAGEIFTRLQQAYSDAGFADEWKQHHQGGATGYLEREWVATPDWFSDCRRESSLRLESNDCRNQD